MMHAAAPAPRVRFDPFRWLLEHPGTVDGVLFGGFTAFLLLGGIVGWTFPLWLLFSIPMFAAGAISRVRPGLSALIIGAFAVLHLVVGQQLIVGDVMIFYALYCATAHGSRRAGRLALAAACIGALMQAVAVGMLYVERSSSLLRTVGEVIASTGATLIFGLIAVGGTWAIGRYQHTRLDQVRLARERAEQAEREREQRAALAVAGERARIAREMHDVVAHSLSVIIAQADGGRFIASQNPEQAASVLETISTTGRAALADMRSLLGVLRHDEESSFGPQPDLAMLPELLERVRATGLTVHEEIVGPLDDLPPAMGLSLFRLVQEALTNVLKHAGPGASASVRVVRDAASLRVEVLDDGRGTDPDSDGQGHGLTGMRERIGLLGGELQAGPLPSRGFRVRAVVPAPVLALDPSPSLSSATDAPPGPVAIPAPATRS